MNNILPPFFKKIDSWLLLNYPRVWASRVHNFLYILLFIFILGFILGLLMSTSFDNTTNYISDTIEVYLTIGLMVVTGAVIWLTRFRAKLAPLNYKENFILTLCFTLLSMLMFMAAWSVTEGHRQRITKSYDKIDIENDFLIATILYKTHDLHHSIDTIEDIKIGDYVIKATETKLVKQNLDYFDAMNMAIDSSEVLNSLGMPEMAYNNDYTARRIEWIKSKNDRIIKSKIAAIRALTTVPDSMVQIFNQLLIKQLPNYNVNQPLSEYRNFETKVSEAAFDDYQLHKITPSRTYLMQKYNCKSFSTVYDNLKAMYALQRQSVMQRLMFNSANDWDYIDPVTAQHENQNQYRNIYKYTYQNNVDVVRKVQIAQNYVDALRVVIREATQRWEFYPLLNQAIWFILLLTIPMLFIVVFGLRHTLFAFLGFIVVVSLFMLLMVENIKKYSFCIYFILFIIILITIFLSFNKSSRHKSWGQLFIATSIFLTFYFVLMIYNNYMSESIGEVTRSYYYHWSIESILMNYGLFVLPLLFMIYNRLTFLPKGK